MRFERLVRGKKPWAAAAAACLLVAVAGLAVAKGLEKSYVVRPEITKETSNLKSWFDRANKIKADFDGEEKRIKESNDNLVKLAAGTKERLYWQLLHEYINSYALPLPNGERLAERATSGTKVKEKYLTPAVRKAFMLLEARRFPDPKKQVDKVKAQAEDQQIKKSLIQINIEGINEMYADDLGPYFKKIHADGKLLFGMSAVEKNRIDEFVLAKEGETKNNLPKAGWVIEIRGFTYHDLKMEFVMDTLVENLRNPDYVRRGVLAAKAPADPAGRAAFKQLKDMDEIIRQRIGYVFVYKEETVQHPEAGNFKVVGQSTLRDVIRGGEAAAKGGAGAIGGATTPADGKMGGGSGGKDAKEADPAAEAAAKRDGWSPIGESASAVLGGGGGGGAGGAGGFGGTAPALGGGAGRRGGSGAKRGGSGMQLPARRRWAAPIRPQPPAAPRPRRAAVTPPCSSRAPSSSSCSSGPSRPPPVRQRPARKRKPRKVRAARDRR